MLSSLRNRLILSHVLPFLIIIPIMGIVLIYVIETQSLLPALKEDINSDAQLLVAITYDHPEIWQDPALAQAFLQQWHASPDKMIMFFGPDGRLLASSSPSDASQIGQIPDSRGLTGLSDALEGTKITHVDYSTRLSGEVVDVFAPVIGSDQKVKGVVRVAFHIESLTGILAQLRYLIITILLIGLFSGGIIGFLLAINIARPVQRVTAAIDDLALGGSREKLPIQGPDELRRLERSVNFLVDRLDNLEHSRRQLLANLVHELGRPLGALRMAIQVSISGAKKDPKVLDELLEGMDGEAARLERLLEDLSHLHGQVLGTLELNRHPIALGEWLPKVLVTWQEAAIKKRLHWEEEIRSDLPTIEVDPDRLAQVVGNLLSNAIKYTQPGGTVSISAGRKDDEVWIRVSDTGPGIRPEEQESVFTPFYRGEQGKRIKQGMGLGLSIARDLVIAHGGRLELESTPGLGSHFTVWIPEHKEDVVSKATQSELSPRS
jgi:signal transduction histidine kinase